MMHEDLILAEVLSDIEELNNAIRTEIKN